MTPNVIIRPELPTDRGAIWSVNHLAFGSDVEASLVDALRDGGFVAVSLVAEIDGHVVGHILFSRLQISGRAEILESLSLAPMAVLPELQRQRIGTQLLTQGLATCRAIGHKTVLVLGHPEFYPKFGFSAELARPLASPFGGGEAWMALELQPDALKDVVGTVEFSPPFATFE